MRHYENYAENKLPLVTFLFILLNVILYYSVEFPSLITSPLEIISHPGFATIGKAILSNFLHLNFEHLFGNMAIMAITGFHVERKFGHRAMALLILLSLIGCTAFTIICMLGSPIPTLGASGVVAGVATVFCLRY